MEARKRQGSGRVEVLTDHPQWSLAMEARKRAESGS